MEARFGFERSQAQTTTASRCPACVYESERAGAGTAYLFSGASSQNSSVLPASRRQIVSVTHRLILPARCRQHTFLNRYSTARPGHILERTLFDLLNGVNLLEPERAFGSV